MFGPLVKRVAGEASETFFGRLLRDVRGNTLAMVGAGLVPLAGMIGSGVDMSRAYMVKNRLQYACDAAALAGRKVMTNNTVNAAVVNEANKFFYFNFPDGSYGTGTITTAVTRPRAGTVQVAADTTVPTAVMKLFGFTSIPIAVSCEASQDFVNVDLVLVLDVTGSMSEKVNGEQKIVTLRDAVMSLYTQLKPTQDLLAANGYRLRYAIVPYSQAVNIGKVDRDGTTNTSLLDLNHIRRTNQRTQVTGSNCVESRQNSQGQWYCTNLQVSMQRLNVTRDDAWLNSSSWLGCVEERQTVVTVGNSPSASELPNMFDLNINMIPENDPQRWPPYDPAAHTIGDFSDSCPAQAVRLKTFTQNEMQTYVNTLQPVGATYHDIGMLWGLRMISDQGVFADSPVLFNGMRTAKYIVFLTDGNLAPNARTYSSYGVEWSDGRVTGTAFTSPKNYYNLAGTESLYNRHQARFAEACRQARQMASVWVIAFAVPGGIDASMTACAHPNQARDSTNRTELIARFAEIAREVNELRVSR